MEWELELASVLDKEQAVLENLAQEADRKTEALKTGDVAALDGIVNREQPLSLRLSFLEKKRQDLLAAAGLSDLPLSRICASATEEHGAGLKNRLAAMTELTGRLKRVNALNSELTRARLEFYHFLTNTGAGYDQGGAARAVSGSALMDKKA